MFTLCVHPAGGSVPNHPRTQAQDGDEKYSGSHTSYYILQLGENTLVFTSLWPELVPEPHQPRRTSNSLQAQTGDKSQVSGRCSNDAMETMIYIIPHEFPCNSQCFLPLSSYIIQNLLQMENMSPEPSWHLFFIPKPFFFLFSFTVYPLPGIQYIFIKWINIWHTLCAWK